MGLPDPRDHVPPARPAICRMVKYRSKVNPYDVPAIITATFDSLWEEGVRRGEVAPLSSAWHVHLHVLTPGKLTQYQEFNVPYDRIPPPGKIIAGERTEPLPGSWRWPERI